MEYIHEIKKGYSIEISLKGWFIGSISATISDIRVIINPIGSTMFVRYQTDSGLIQYIADKIEDRKIGD